jgi:SPP1 gp7 family putative phage head morphogenesis protein
MKLVRPLVLANFGDIECRFEFIPYSSGDISEYLKIWVEAVRAQVYAPTEEDVNYFKSIIGFPESKEEGKPSPVKKPPKKGEPKTDIEKDEYATRNLTKYEKKMDFQQIRKDFDKHEEKVSRTLNSLSKDIQDSLVDQIKNKGLLKKFKPEAIDNIKPKNKQAMAVELRDYYKDFFNESLDQAKKDIFPEGTKGFAIELLPEQFLDLLKVEAFKAVDDYSVNITKRAKNTVIQAVKDGIGEAETIRLVKDGLKNESEKWIKTVVRTKTTEIYNEARKRYWETDPLAKQIVVAYQWSSIIDDRTSDVCRFLDQKIFSVGEIANHVKPPAHMNCRSVLVPITKFEDFEESPKSDFNLDKLKDKGGGLLKP